MQETSRKVQPQVLLEPLMSTEEVAIFLGVPIRTLYGWSTRGTGPDSFKVGRHTRYRREEVEAWLEGRAARTTS